VLVWYWTIIIIIIIIILFITSCTRPRVAVAEKTVLPLPASLPFPSLHSGPYRPSSFSSLLLSSLTRFLPRQRHMRYRDFCATLQRDFVVLWQPWLSRDFWATLQRDFATKTFPKSGNPHWRWMCIIWKWRSNEIQSSLFVEKIAFFAEKSILQHGPIGMEVFLNFHNNRSVAFREHS
jgi:hypothetical protein